MVQLLAVIVAALTLLASFPGEKEYSAQAKISIKKACQIALHAYPGTIVSKGLEKEAGGSGLRYSIDVKGASGTREIGVDAITGKVLENSEEKGGD